MLTALCRQFGVTGLAILMTSETLPNYAAPDSLKHDFRDAMQVELVHDVGTMGLDGARTDGEQRGNFLVRPSFGDQLKDLTFTCR